MSDEIINTAIIGTGFGSVVQYPAFLAHPNFNPTLLVGRHTSKTLKIAQKLEIPNHSTDWETAIKDPEIDLVSIATPPALHKEMTLAAFDAGKHVICEKPLAMSVEEAEEMVDAAEDSGLVAMVDLEFRYLPSKLHFVDLIKSGYLGDIYQFDVSVRTPSRLNPRKSGYNWWSDASQGGGILGALGSHYIDYLYQIFDNINGVSGRTAIHIKKRLNKQTGKMGSVTADDAFLCQFDVGNDILCSMKISSTSPYGKGSRIEAYGSEGSLILLENDQIIGGKIGEDRELKHIPKINKFLMPRTNGEHYLIPAFTSLLSDFAHGVARGSSPHPNFKDGLKIQKCMQAIRDSDDKKKWIYLK